MTQRLDRGFFGREADEVARQLLGCRLIRDGDTWLAGRIVETEAYFGEEDPASHAYRGKTGRNEIMYGPPGNAYVYVCYGIHHMLNVTTGERGDPQAVLIRAVQPINGIDEMQDRRGGKEETALCDGPGKVCEAFGLDKQQNGTNLTEGELRIEQGERQGGIATSGRIGVSEGGDLELRFYEKDNPYVS